MEGCELQVTGDLELAVETSTLIKPSLGLQPSALNMATAQAETPAWALRLLEASVQGLWSNCCRRHGRSEQKDGNWDFKAGQGLAEAAAACVLHQASCFWKQRGQGLERLLAQVKEHKSRPTSLKCHSSSQNAGRKASEHTPSSIMARHLPSIIIDSSSLSTLLEAYRGALVCSATQPQRPNDP